MSTETVTARRFAKMRPVPLVDAPPVDRAELPPGPRLHGLLQSIGLLRFRHQFVPYLRRKYGDVFSIKIMPEGRHLVVFNRPEHVKEIFSGDPEVFHAGKGNAILGPVMGEHSLLLVDSAQHKRARRLLMPAFNGHALRGYEDLVTGLAKTEVGRWHEGVAFASLERMNALTLEVILQVVFGVTDEDRLGELRPLVNKTVNIPPLVFLGWGFPKLQKYGPWRRTIENQVELDRVMFRVISERRQAPDLAERSDVLSRLLQVRDENGEGLTDEELRDQLVTLLLAGHETTATALAWAFHELARDPAQQAAAIRAADGGDEKYLEAVTKEAMRLHPVISEVARKLTKDVEIGGYRIPAGFTVMPSIGLVHSDDEHHPDPLAFRPDRFLDGGPPTGTWFPFGGGARRCLGAGFSLLEANIVLREVFTRFRIAPDRLSPEPAKPRHITLVPGRGARITVTPRS
jgi:cytochrome P450